MKRTVCMDHNHVLWEKDVTFAREIGRKFYDGEPSHRPELSVWGWIIVRSDGSVCHGYGGEPKNGKKQYMKDAHESTAPREKRERSQASQR